MEAATALTRLFLIGEGLFPDLEELAACVRCACVAALMRQ